MRDWDPDNVVALSKRGEPQTVEAESFPPPVSAPLCTVSSPDALYEEMARLLDHASVTLDSAAGIPSEMARGLKDEAKRLG